MTAGFGGKGQSTTTEVKRGIGYGLTGSSGADWFIIGDGDLIPDFKKVTIDGDLVTTL